MNRLVGLVLDQRGEVREDIAARVLADLSRGELKKFLAALRLELRRRVVQVGLAGDAGPGLDAAIGRTWPGRALRVREDPALGAGVKVSAGDDVVDASVHGYIREIIEELGST
ncbi:MAG TPA: F0F1 ATP synthase subunit delta [Spirochaetia bacterium]|nr:F0F1 ATP synthase subunit delta [Spirochaetia bacterium]